MTGVIFLLLTTILHVSYGATIFNHKVLEKENIGYFGPVSEEINHFNTTSRIDETATGLSFRQIWCSGNLCQNGVESCKNDKCDCTEGLSGNDCGQVIECTGDLNSICDGLSLKCIYDVKTKAKATCECNEVNQKFDGKACRGTCKPSDSNCKFGTSCQLQNGYYFCLCAPDLTGDFCEVITACQPGGKYEKCTATGGDCIFLEGKPFCKCENDKIFDVSQGICREERSTTVEEEFSTLNTDCDCGVNSYMCVLGVNGEKVCSCFLGYAQVEGICTGFSKIWIVTIVSISINAVLLISFLCYCCILRRCLCSSASSFSWHFK